MSEISRWKRFGLVACTALLAATAAFAITVPRPLADMSIPIPGGKPVSLKQYRGKVVLVALLSMECQQCLKSIDILNRIQRDFGNKGFQVVAAMGDNNAQYLLGPFIQRYRPEFPLGYVNIDEMIKLGDFKFADRPFAPIFLFVNRQGIVKQQTAGNEQFFKNEDGETRAVIQKMLVSQ